MDGPNIIGLADVTGGGAISLEPGGQFELSGAPVETVHQTCAELMAHLAQLREVARPLGIGFLGLGMSPKWTLAETPVMPKSRYKIMTAYMPKVGTLRPRHDVPHLHGADEPRLLLRSRHGEEAARVARAAAGRDRAVREFAVHRRQAERLSLDRAPRSGATPTMRAPACCRSRSSTAWASSAMSITRSTCRCISSSATTNTSTCRGFRSAICWPASCPGHGNCARRISDWVNHVSTIFPEVRLKRFLEMRGADGGPWRRLPAHPAFWVGILYDDASLDAAWDLVKDWSAEERQKLRDDVPRLGFKAEIRGRAMLELAQRLLCELARRGLKRRKRLDQRRPRRDALSAAACRNSSRAASRRPKNCSRNITGRGAARSSRCSPSMRISERHCADDDHGQGHARDRRADQSRRRIHAA